MEYSGITYISGITQNKYFISCDPGHKDGDHTIIWIKSDDDDTAEMITSKGIEYMNEVLLKVFRVPKKYLGK